ncbi:MAG: hypothetical protein GYA86_07540 [Firmicutes bacterium]|nr:hypothetical protein [Bacillota bacterium]
MSLARISLGGAVRQQYRFKLRTYANLYLSLVAVQVIALLFSAGGVGAIGMGWNNINIELKFFSGAVLFVFTALWIAFNSFILTLPFNRNIDFSFVTSRLSSNLANIAFLVTAAIAGGITAVLGLLLQRNIFYYTGAGEQLLEANFSVAPGELFTGMAVAVLYLLLFSAAGYFAGALIQLHRLLYVVLPALLLGALFYEAAHEFPRLLQVIDFFRFETSPPLFILKIVLSVLLLWAGAALLSNRIEIQ